MDASRVPRDRQFLIKGDSLVHWDAAQMTKLLCSCLLIDTQGCQLLSCAGLSVPLAGDQGGWSQHEGVNRGWATGSEKAP